VVSLPSRSLSSEPGKREGILFVHQVFVPMQLRHDSRCVALLRMIAVSICLSGYCRAEERRGYLFISSVTDQAVYYAKLLDTLQQANNEKMSAEKLTSAGQVGEPRGLAVDHVRKILYVMDTGRQALLAINLKVMENGDLQTFETTEVVKGVVGLWVAVDSAGTVFYTDKEKIWSFDVDSLHHSLTGNAQEVSDLVEEAEQTGDLGTTEAPAEAAIEGQHLPLYNDEALQQVNTPQGLAANGHLFWVNGANGQQDGILLRGSQAPEVGNEAASISQLAVNIDVARGVCLSSSRVFYTNSEKEVYSTKMGGGPVVMVTGALNKPQGCVWDGDGTIFVADEEGNKVVSFSGGGINMGPRQVATALEVPAAFGVAVLQSGASRPHLLGLTLVAVICAFL